MEIFTTIIVADEKHPLNHNIDTAYKVSSIDEALEKVKELRSKGVTLPLTIRIADGVWEMSKTIDIDSEINNITIEPFGEAVALSGGVTLKDPKKATFNGVECLSFRTSTGHSC